MARIYLDEDTKRNIQRNVEDEARNVMQDIMGYVPDFYVMCVDDNEEGGSVFFLIADEEIDDCISDLKYALDNLMDSFGLRDGWRSGGVWGQSADVSYVADEY